MTLPRGLSFSIDIMKALNDSTYQNYPVCLPDLESNNYFLYFPNLKHKEWWQVEEACQVSVENFHCMVNTNTLLPL